MKVWHALMLRALRDMEANVPMRGRHYGSFQNTTLPLLALSLPLSIVSNVSKRKQVSDAHHQVPLSLPAFLFLFNQFAEKMTVVDGSCGGLISKTRAGYNADYKGRGTFHRTEINNCAAIIKRFFIGVDTCLQSGFPQKCGLNLMKC